MATGTRSRRNALRNGSCSDCPLDMFCSPGDGRVRKKTPTASGPTPVMVTAFKCLMKGGFQPAGANEPGLAKAGSARPSGTVQQQLHGVGRTRRAARFVRVEKPGAEVAAQPGDLPFCQLAGG